MTVVAKLGSSIVASEDGTVRADVLDEVCDQIAALRVGPEPVVLVTSGAIALGLAQTGRSRRPGSMDELQALSALGQGPLYAEYERRLRARDIPCAQVLLTAPDMETRSHYVNARQTLRRLLDWDVVPVVNENDTTSTDEITFGDNDFLAAQVAVLLHARLLVLLTNTAGLFTADPRRDPSARLVERVDDFDQIGGLEIDARPSTLGRGGMASKVGAARLATSTGTEVVVCDGTLAGALRAAVEGRPGGTRFAPRPRSASSFKLWLLHAKPTQGTVHVDAGAARVLRESGRSLLPVGIKAVHGEFRAGEAVEVACDGAAIGKGIASYSASELRRIAGLKSEQVRALMPHASDEAVHRDHFVLLD